MRLRLCIAIACVAVCLRSVAAQAWATTRDTSDTYLVRSEVTGEITSNSRCAKVNGRTQANGYRAVFRAINTDDSENYWQSVRGARNSYAALPEAASDGLWRYLGGAAQVFASFENRLGSQVSYFGALDCGVWADNRISSPTGAPFYTTGYVLAPGPTNDILAYNEQVSALHALPFTPVIVNMNPGINFPIDDATPWQMFETDFGSFAPNNLKIRWREFPPLANPVDGGGVSAAEWQEYIPTRQYSEKQCVAWMDENDRLQTEPPEPVAVTGVIGGGPVMCNFTSITERWLDNIATEVVFSRNTPNEPLTVPQGLFLVIIPALWEAVITAFLLSVRLAKKKTERGGFAAKTKWFIFELATLSVSLAEFALLVTSTLQQNAWQPCQIGRTALGNKDLIVDGNPPLFAGAPIVDVRIDTVLVECYQDPGTDLAWAVVIGVVAMAHIAVLVFEGAYLSSDKVRVSVDRSVDGVRSWCGRCMGARGDDDDDEDDDEDDDNEDENVGERRGGEQRDALESQGLREVPV